MTESAPHHPDTPESEVAQLRRLFDDPLNASDLSLEQQLAWTFSIVAMGALHSDFDSAFQRQCGLTSFEFYFLMQLYGTDAPGSAGELPMSVAARRVDSSLSRLSHVVRRLEDRGWVSRRSSPRGARVTLVRLTDEGRARVEGCGPVYDRAVHEMFVDRLDEDDVAHLTRIMAKVLAGRRPGFWLLALAQAGTADGAGA